ncbi:MAG: ABC transporter substrate-binding protein [Hyphomonadaceae bacterium]|jgi:NitT/TauT family transport system substrate-binding protein|nr:ABC transporter substrate-binding protein [Hyphomonadaceae bacterium]
MKHLWRLLALTPLMVGAVPQAMAQTPIKVSYQPALYWALPYYVATENKFWADAGLTPEFSTFPAGAPQVAAAQAKAWDVGGTGSVPAVLGAARFGLVTIGITNDESKANVLMVRADKFEAAKKDPTIIKGQKILLTTNSTGDYSVQACLKKWGIAKADVQLVNLGQAQIISAVSSNNGDFAGVWAPNNYTLAEKANAKLLCSGHEAGAIVPGALIARPDFAKENPDAVARYLAVYLRAWAWIGAHPKEARAMMKRFYAQGGVEISDAGMESEFADRPVFGLDAQIRILDRSKGKSDVDTWLGNIGAFMQSVGTIPAVPDTKGFIDDAFMKRVAADPKLRAIATKAD